MLWSGRLLSGGRGNSDPFFPGTMRNGADFGRSEAGDLKERGVMKRRNISSDGFILS